MATDLDAKTPPKAFGDSRPTPKPVASRARLFRPLVIPLSTETNQPSPYIRICVKRKGVAVTWLYAIGSSRPRHQRPSPRGVNAQATDCGHSVSGGKSTDSASPAFARSLAAQQLTSVADVGFAIRILRMRPDAAERLVVVHARNVDPRNLKENNVIPIGGPRSNPWTGLFEDRLNFRFDFSGERAWVRIRDARPQPGEPLFYETKGRGGTATQAFARLALAPNLNYTGRVFADRRDHHRSHGSGHRVLPRRAGRPVPDRRAGTAVVGGQRIRDSAGDHGNRRDGAQFAHHRPPPAP